jgi:hypothetical protein
MIFTSRFSATQAALGVQFYDSSGTLLGSRITAGIVALPEAGSYQVDIMPPTGAAGIYWNDTGTGATALEDLRDALAIEGLNVAASDPWLAAVPASYADGTAGAALGRLNNTAADEPIAIIPAPPGDASLCNVFVNTESISNAKRAGVAITFTLVGSPTKSERVLETDSVKIVTDADGHASTTLQRTDNLTPAGRYYLVNSPKLGLLNRKLYLTSDTFDLSNLIS